MVRLVLFLPWLTAFAASLALAQPVRIVAVENVYGDIAAQVGGAEVAVTSILASASQDPHEFEATPAVARELADAQLVIVNGAGYDAWTKKLLGASRRSSRQVIEVATLAPARSGADPHFWYDVRIVSALAAALATRLGELDPAHRADYASRRQAFEASMQPLREKIASMRAKYRGTAVTATEPVFDSMAAQLGLAMRNRRFQLAIMNGSEPGAADVAAFERDLRGRAVKALLYNTQAPQPLGRRMRAIAIDAGVPVVAITETKPAGRSYQAWMLGQLDALDRALGAR